ncbi:GNAT family N-acetyltransferase [Mesobacillus foraminis]|uniref:GNAT family N-acetyltransferase n=1 Tax=Mesobacillus foraminis TaxID=279826 RepID=UPI00399F22BB
MNIRLLTPEDANLYRDIRLAALKSNPAAFAASYEEEFLLPQSVFEERLQQGDTFTYGAFEGDRLAGVVTLVREKKLKLRHRTSIFALFVSPAFRGKGVGKMLMKEAITKAGKLEGVEQVYLTVVANNEAAINLYKNLKFQTYGRDNKAIKQGDQYLDEDLMVLFL